MFRKPASLALAALTFLALGAHAADPKGGLNPVDFKNALKRAIDAEKLKFHNQFPDLRLQNPCIVDYNAAVRAAEAEHAACLDADSPPAGSPLADFNNLSNAQLAAKCGSKTLDQCVADVIAQQTKFCAKERAIDLAKAKSKLRTCCQPLNQQKADLQKQLDAVNEALKSCLGQ